MDGGKLTSADERPALSGTNGRVRQRRDATRCATSASYIALNPGASYRAARQSWSNFLGNAAPQMLLCLHEESAVAIAHGYAKVTGKAMAAAVQRRPDARHHGDLQRLVRPHAVMVLGATGRSMPPSAAPGSTGSTRRAIRALVRPYTKWDDQPASPARRAQSLMRASFLAHACRKGRCT